MAYVRQARWVAKPGEAAAVEAALRALIAPSRAEPGCLLYEPARDEQDDHVFHMVEIFTDKEAFLAHCATGYVKTHVLQRAIPRLLERSSSGAETLGALAKTPSLPPHSESTPTKGTQR